MARPLLQVFLVVAALMGIVPGVALGHELDAKPRSMAAMPALPAAADSPDAPDLRITLPSGPYEGQVAPVYVDAFERPGRLLYRFDSMIHNTGGALDLFGGRGEVRQKVWPGGDPSTAPAPDAAPPGEADDRFDDGARLDYVFEDTHNHWHFFSAARYSLQVPGGPARVSDKVGFCMFDSFGTPGGATWWFPWEVEGGTWCTFGRPDSTFVRMGLSRGATDRYSAQREFQYVDVTGLAPGEYGLRAEANPSGHLVEADPTDNVHEEPRVLPGVRAAAAATATEPARAVGLTLAAEALAPEVPARAGPGVPPGRTQSCRPSATSRACYAWPADAPLRFAVTEPSAHGAVTLDGATATYTPAPGFEGTDRFTYAATDARGLTSAPAAVEVRVARGSTPASAGVTTGPPAPRPLVRIGAARRSGRALAVAVHCRRAAVGACRGTLAAALAGRRLGRRRLPGIAPGRAATVRIRLSRADLAALARSPRRRVVLTASVRDALGAGVRARRAAQPAAAFSSRSARRPIPSSAAAAAPPA